MWKWYGLGGIACAAFGLLCETFVLLSVDRTNPSRLFLIHGAKPCPYTPKAPQLAAGRLCDLGDLYSCVATLYLVDDGVPFAVDLGGY